jgi:hypothetical protein
MGRSGELGDFDVPGIERLDETLDRSALTGRVPALEDHTNWRTQALMGRGARICERPLATEGEPELAQP